MNNSLKDITGIVVSYNTKDLLQKALESIRQFYPQLHIIIIDGSSPDNSCYHYITKISQKDLYITAIQVEFNIGHGPGMDLGINMCKTKYAVIFDSDIVMIKPPIEKMLSVFEDHLFGMGKIIPYPKKSPLSFESSVFCKYLHPYFQIIQPELYKKFQPYAHHCSPCFFTMWDIFNKHLSHYMLKEFPVKEYIEHEQYGTRNLNPVSYKQNWKKDF